MITRLYSNLNTTELYGGGAFVGARSKEKEETQWFQLDTTPLDSIYKLK